MKRLSDLAGACHINNGDCSVRAFDFLAEDANYKLIGSRELASWQRMHRDACWSAHHPFYEEAVQICNFIAS